MFQTSGTEVVQFNHRFFITAGLEAYTMLLNRVFIKTFSQLYIR